MMRATLSLESQAPVVYILFTAFLNVPYAVVELLTLKVRLMPKNFFSIWKMPVILTGRSSIIDMPSRVMSATYHWKMQVLSIFIAMGTSMSSN